VANQVLTVGELEGMQTLLTGLASFCTGTLHPTGAAKVPMIHYVAHGALDNGRAFQVHVTLLISRPSAGPKSYF
jgi:hypothetical protein